MRQSALQSQIGFQQVTDLERSRQTRNDPLLRFPRHRVMATRPCARCVIPLWAAKCVQAPDSTPDIAPGGGVFSAVFPSLTGISKVRLSNLRFIGPLR